jgi:DNA-binding response OmpR family regulator
MKQIEIIKTYARKRCLVVDDLPDARALLKRILVDFGATQTDTVGNAEEAIDLCQKRQYDIVIADYNLGPGKNGQQLLEELRYHKLLSQASLFIMITAESAVQYVLHTLEYEPDDFLNKPVNRDSLRPRLDTALLKGEYLSKVKRALDQERLDIATHQAEALVNQEHRFQNDVRKLLLELYLRAHKSDDALELCQSLDQDRLPIWAQLGKARALGQLKRFEEAEHQLQVTSRNSPYCVEAQDQLAEVYEQSHRMAQSQQALLNAVKISPRHAARQRELGRVSQNIEDENTSVHAYRAAIRHSKNSCHESPGDLANLAQSLVKLAAKTPSQKNDAILKEAKECISALDKKYQKQPIILMRKKLVQADLASQSGDENASVKLTDEAVELHDNMRYSVIGNTEKQICIDCALAFINHGRYDEGEAILQELARLNKDKDFVVKIDKLLREPQTKEGVAFAAHLNKEGISCYEKGKIDEAIRSFRQVLQELPNHIGLNLNLIQALTSKHKKSGLSATELELLSTCFKRIGQLKTGSSYSDRFDYLLKRFNKIQAGRQEEAAQ